LEELKELRDTLIDCANAVDGMIKLSERESNGEKITDEEKEAVQGKMIMKFLKMSQLSETI
jgi:hypothetical protein